MALNSSEEIINDIRLGKMVILMDDEDRENEGDLVIAAECVTAEHINFMAKHARGLICLTLTGHRCDQLNLPPMVQDNQCVHNTNFTMSIEAAEGVTTGISAADRAYTVRTAVAKNASPADIVQPGHIFPLRAQKGGVLNRAGHTAAGCEVARLGGLEPASGIVEIMNDDGTMARMPELLEFAKTHDLKIGTIADLIHYRMMNEKSVEFLDEGQVETEFGPFTMQRYRDTLYEKIHFVLKKGEIDSEQPTMTRVHVPNTVRDVLLANVPGDYSNWNIPRSLQAINQAGSGVLVLLAGEESEANKIFSSDVVLGKQALPDAHPSGATEINLSVGLGSQLIREAGVRRMKLMSNPIKYNAISGFDLEIVEFVSYQSKD